MPKVSVCIPVYGVEKYIERCVRSLFEQTMKDDIEFIFVDDCTPDKSIKIMQKILEEYPDRKNQTLLLRHEENKGLVAARKTALDAAQGEYIIHCDSDDWVDVNMYEVMYNKAIETNADMVYCNCIINYRTDKYKIPHIKEITKAEDFIGEICCKALNYAGLWSKLYKRNIACRKDFFIPDHIFMNEDTLRNIQMLLCCQKIVFCNDVFYHYDCHNILKHNKKSYFNNKEEIYEWLRGNLPQNILWAAEAYKGNMLRDLLVYPHAFTSLERKNILKKYSIQLSGSHLCSKSKILLFLLSKNYFIAHFFYKAWHAIRKLQGK